MNWDDNAEARLAHDLVLHTSMNLFLTGRAGTGKTTFLRTLCQELKKTYVIVASTGIAALNAEGSTLHSQFKLPTDPYPPAKDPQGSNELLKSVSRDKLMIIKSLSLIIIDEVSMVRADTLQALSDRLCRERRSSEPFAGVQLLLIGDLYQLPPVENEDWKWVQTYYTSSYFFSSIAFKRSTFYFIELKKIYRQREQTFIELLESIRTGCSDSSVLKQLNTRVSSEEIHHLAPGEVMLTARRNQSKAYNQKCLEALKGESVCFEAVCEGEFVSKDAPTEASLYLKRGAQVMFVRNDAEGLFVNGEIGIVTDLTEKEVTVSKVGGGMPVKVGKVKWERYAYTLNTSSGKLEKQSVGTFIQIPLCLAWAITIHKSQGLTFDHVSIQTAGIFASGQLYVALSRCRSLAGIQLNAPVPESAVKVDPRIAVFLNYCQEHYTLPEGYTVDISQSNNQSVELSFSTSDYAGIDDCMSELEDKVYECIDTGRPVIELLKERGVSSGELYTCVDQLLKDKKVELQKILAPRVLKMLVSYYQFQPELPFSRRRRDIKGFGINILELQWYDHWYRYEKA